MQSHSPYTPVCSEVSAVFPCRQCAQPIYRIGKRHVRLPCRWARTVLLNAVRRAIAPGWTCTDLSRTNLPGVPRSLGLHEAHFAERQPRNSIHPKLLSTVLVAESLVLMAMLPPVEGAVPVSDFVAAGAVIFL